MRLIPGKTKVRVELFKGISLADIIIGGISAGMLLLVLTSTIPGKLIIAGVLLLIAAALLARLDEEPNYVFLLHIVRHLNSRRFYEKPFTDRALGSETESKDDAALEEFVKSAPEDREFDAKARRKAEKEERKADDKILKSKTATKEEKDAIWLKRAQQSAAQKQSRAEESRKKENGKAFDVKDIIAFTDIRDGRINYNGKYYGAVIEIPPVEFRFFSPSRRVNSIENALGRLLRSVPMEYAVNIVKLDRPVIYDSYIDSEYEKLDNLRSSYEQAALSEDEFKNRAEVLFERINDLRDISFNSKIVQPYYYIVLFDGDRQQLENSVSAAIDNLVSGEMRPHRLDDKELAVFLKYTNSIDFDERDIEHIAPDDYAAWAMPQTVKVRSRTAEINNIVTHNLRIVNYPTVVGDAWLASVLSFPSTKVVIKCTPMDRSQSIRGIDRSLQELRGRYANTGIDSKRIELMEHIETLESLLAMLKSDNETLMEMNAYVTLYDIVLTNETPGMIQPPPSVLTRINNMKRVVRKTYQEYSLRLNNMEFDQLNAFIGSQISAWDPMFGKGRGIPSNTIAAAYPWVFATVSDRNGIKLGSETGVPVFIDFFRRDSERVNSNMVIVGKSGSGKSYAAKSLLTNLAADDAKIFILDPENEYADLVNNLHGKYINVGNAQYGRLNPFHIITALDDDEAGGGSSNSYATHLQFLEEFFRQVLPDCDKDALEYLSSLMNQTYASKGITPETDLSKLKPEDYPIFDDLYDAILTEFQATNNDYIITILRTLLNYVEKFSTGGRNASIWNGPSTITTDENFIVFNFQSMLANRNTTSANAQMLLVLKYIDNEIIKNRDYNIKHHLNRKIVVVIDEAHVFIDTKFPIALDFMFQLAKRIRKYNGMQIVITQNIKDFVGSEEIARKSTAIINACQYSFIFALSPNDMDDLCTLYEKAGGINEQEQEQIVQAQRGQVFTVMSPTSRSSFKIGIPNDVAAMFRERPYTSRFFNGEDGAQAWEDFLGDSRAKHEAALPARNMAEATENEENDNFDLVFTEIDEEEYEKLRSPRPAEAFVAWTEVQNAHTAPSPSYTELPETPTFSGQSSSNAELQKLVSQMSQALETVNRYNYDSMIREVQRMIEDNNTQIAAALSTEAADIGKSYAEFIAQPTETVRDAANEASYLDELFDRAARDYETTTDTEHLDEAETSAVDAYIEKVFADESAQETETSEEDMSGKHQLGRLRIANEPNFDLDSYTEDTDDSLSEDDQTVASPDSIDAYISSLLSHMKETPVSNLELMEEHDEMTIQITLDDLKLYIENHRA